MRGVWMRGGRQFLAPLAVVFLAMTVSWPAAAQEAEPGLHDVAERQLHEHLAADPESLSQLGNHEELGLENPNARLTPRGPARKAEDVARLERWREEIEAFDPDRLSGQPALTRKILLWDYGARLERAELPYVTDVFARSVYALDHMDGIHVGLPSFMTSIHPLEDEQDARDYIKRLEAFGTAFDQTIAAMEAQEEQGVVPPAIVLEKALKDMRGFVTDEAAENALVTHLAGALEKMDGIDAGTREDLLSGAAKAVEKVVHPAYERLIAKTESLLNQASQDVGVWRLPQGEALYAASLRSQTTTDMSPDEIHELGLKEVGRIVAEMDRILKAQGYDEGTVGERMNALAEEDRFIYPDTEKGREQLLRDLRSMLDDMQARLPEWFGELPEQKVILRRVPEFSEGSNTIAYYWGPSIDGSRPGVYYINLRDPTILPKYNAPTLTYHEAIPGHHLQIALAQKIEGLPLIRRVTGFNAYVEGWALYAEELVKEMGVYKDDPFAELGQLQYELWRAVRLVVDTGMHHEKWSRKKAIEYMRETTGMSRHDVETEIDRYIVWPGQACGYKIGQLTIKRLRKQAKERLGEDFDIKAFHDAVLTSGAMPLAVLDSHVGQWPAQE
ncbi:MAG: DUF885 domain-containing protein [Alphaproteobacteria bacterium]